MSSVTNFSPPTMEEIILKAIEFREPRVRRKNLLFESFAHTATQLDSLAEGLRELLMTHKRIRIDVPRIPPAGAEIAALSYDAALRALEKRLRAFIEQLKQSLLATKLGRIRWHDFETCQFSFDDVSMKRGVLNNTVTRQTFRHDLAKARVHRLPAPKIPKPEKAEAMILAMPEPLMQACRLVTGMLIVKEDAGTETDLERTTLGRSVDAVAAGAAQFKDSVVSRLGQFRTAIVHPGASMQLAKRDPVIILAEFCLLGWED